LYVFRNMRLSVSDKYPQVYRLATQGAQNSVPWPRRGFFGLASQTRLQPSNLNVKHEKSM